MRPFKITLGIVITVLVACLAWLFLAYPKAGPPLPLTVQATPARLERGKYLFEHVLGCYDCHSQRDWDHHSGPVVSGTIGAGGERFARENNLPCTIHVPNITPATLAGWTDGEIARAIVSGVTRDGTVLVPIMPYELYRNLEEEDLHSLVAHLRTLAPMQNVVPPREVSLPMQLVVRVLPRPYVPPVPVNRTDRVAYGRYLATVAGCAECHTIRDEGEPRKGMQFAGGREFGLPAGGGIVRSSNITPDVETGIGAWSELSFITRFKSYDGEIGRQMPTSVGGRPNTLMPWTSFAGMTKEDLSALYAFLRTVPPIRNKVKL